MHSPPERSPERLRHHYEADRELAARLRASTREERTELFKRLYGELFERVPDHPRLTRRDTPERSRRNIEIQLRLLEPHLREDAVLVEFAPGDCRLAHAAAARCAHVHGIDISDQRAPGEPVPANCELVVYNGYALDLPDGVADIAFSYQFLEHLHPDDVDLHFRLVHRLLKPGGVYVFDTPHRFSGPHDISRLFGGRLDCFHFQEWTYRSMRALLQRHGFGRSALHRGGRLREGSGWNLANDGTELLLGVLPSARSARAAPLDRNASPPFRGDVLPGPRPSDGSVPEKAGRLQRLQGLPPGAASPASRRNCAATARCCEGRSFSVRHHSVVQASSQRR